MEDSIAEFVILGLDALVVGTLGYFYNKNSKKISSVENALEVNLNDFKSKRNYFPPVIDYALVSGEVQPKKNQVSSIYHGDIKGVIRTHEIKQFGTRWNEKQQKSENFTRTIINELIDEPFHLFHKQSNTRVDVINAKNAESVRGSLECTHYKYDKSNESVLQAIATYLVANEVTNGVEITENMLRNGTFIYGYGRLEKLADGSFALSKPLDSDNPFLLTRQNRLTLLDNMRLDTQVLKAFLIIFGTIGAATAAWCVYSIYQKYKKNKKSK